TRSTSSEKRAFTAASDIVSGMTRIIAKAAELCLRPLALASGQLQPAAIETASPASGANRHLAVSASSRHSMLALMSDHRPLHELRGWLDQIRTAPSTEGRIELIVRRPAVEARE